VADLLSALLRKQAAGTGADPERPYLYGLLTIRPGVLYCSLRTIANALFRATRPLFPFAPLRHAEV